VATITLFEEFEFLMQYFLKSFLLIMKEGSMIEKIFVFIGELGIFLLAVAIVVFAMYAMMRTGFGESNIFVKYCLILSIIVFILSFVLMTIGFIGYFIIMNYLK
jgi:hypothetical protein